MRGALGMKPSLRLLSVALLGLILASCGSRGPGVPSGDGGHYKLGRPYQINGQWYHPAYDPNYRSIGVASWYGDPFHGRQTANGERFDKRLLSAAHPTLPLPSYVRVRNLENGRELTLRVNDRGPFASNRLIDLSEAAAEELGFKQQGLARVEVQFLRLAASSGTPPAPTVASGRAPTRTASASAPPARSLPACNAFDIQVAAFRDAGNARVAERDLRRRLGGNVAVRSERQDGLTRVRVGPLIGDANAQAALRRVFAADFRDAYLTPAAVNARDCTVARV